MTFENRGACVHRKQTVGCKETSKNKPQDSISKASTKDVIKSDETLDLEATTQSKTITSLVRHGAVAGDSARYMPPTRPALCETAVSRSLLQFLLL